MPNDSRPTPPKARFQRVYRFIRETSEDGEPQTLTLEVTRTQAEAQCKIARLSKGRTVEVEIQLTTDETRELAKLLAG